MTPALEAQGVGKRYRRNWALRSCSIGLPSGSIGALVGPNGAGKTTLLHLAVGLLRPTEGSVRVLGWEPREEPQLVLSRIGFVAQDTPLYRRYSAAELLHLGRSLNRRWNEVGARSRLRSLGIPLDRPVGRMSGGQRAQVALAMALAKQPELLLLDEPLASLDPLARRQFLQGLMDAAIADGLTVLLSSHLVTELERVCDYLVILGHGNVRLAGDLQELLAQHWLLVGPRRAERSGLGPMEVIMASETERQVSVWARGEPPAGDGWRATPLSLEELVLAYLGGAERPPAPLEAVGA
jgi:ABC-2 type transport system ATP-binding protein